MPDVPANIVSPEGVLSHAHLFEPKGSKLNPKLMHSTNVLFTAAAMASPMGVALRGAVVKAAVEKWGQAAFETMVKEGTFESPFRRDLSSKGYDGTVYDCFVSSSSGADYPPAVVANVMEPDPDKPGKQRRKPITDRREIYPGARAHVSFATRAYGGPGTTYKPGVKLDLRNVCKVGDGTRLAGGSSGDADADFGGVQAATPEPVTTENMADLLK